MWEGAQVCCDMFILIVYGLLIYKKSIATCNRANEFDLRMVL